MKERLVVLGLALALAACGRGPASLVLDVRTDLLPAVQFDAVRTEILDGESTGSQVDREAEVGMDFTGGQRVAELDEIAEDSISVRVTLLRGEEEVLSRSLRVELAAVANAATVLMASPCVGVECPAGEACLGGGCVDDRCSETSSEFCPTMCAATADCPSASACTTVECTGSGTCFSAPDHASCGADALCDATVGCVDLSYDLGAGLEANLVEGSGMGTDAPQPREGGWEYLYVPRTLFGRYGALGAGILDPSGWLEMETTRLDIRAGWFAAGVSAGVSGNRGHVYLYDWDATFVSEGGDTISIGPENAVLPIALWRAPIAGRAELTAEVRVRNDNTQSDVEVHVIAVRGGVGEDLSFAYLSGDGADDANGEPTISAPRADPYLFEQAVDLEAGDGLGLLMRIGDDDAFDTAFARGTIRFTP